MRTFALCILLLSISAFADDFNWAGTWNVEPKSQDVNCCYPDNGVVVTMNADKTATAEGKWSQSHCKWAGLGWKESAAISDDGKSVRLAFPFGVVTVEGTLTATNDVDTVEYLSVAGDLHCPASFKRVKNTPPAVLPTPARDFSGTWQVKPTSNNPICCYPKSPVKIRQDGNMATAHIDWDTANEACKDYLSIDQTVEIKEDNKVALPFYNKDPAVFGVINKNGETAKFELSICTADFTREPNTAITANAAGATGAAGAGANGTTGAGGAAHTNDSGKKGPGVGVYIGVAIGVIIILGIAYYLYTRHKAEKLRENLRSNYQAGLLAN